MWAYEGIFYQIYPIGFCGAPTANDGKTVSRILKLGLEQLSGILRYLFYIIKSNFRIRQSWL